MRSGSLPTPILAAVEAEVPDRDASAALLAGIREAYVAPERHYHNLQHLAHLAGELESVRDDTSDWNLLMLAAAWHDIVYDTARPDNEEASAARAAADLAPFLEPARLQHLQTVILATKHHEKAEAPDTNLFCDADLAILGAAPDAYDIYAAQIRAEYSRYADVLYRPGRAAVLQKLLDQPALFKSEVFRLRYEAAARDNLARELGSL